MKKVIFSLSFTCLAFFGHTQLNVTFQSDNVSENTTNVIMADANSTTSALPSLENERAVILIESDKNTNDANQSDGLFEKIVYVDVRLDQDSVLFKPFSKAWGKHWMISSDLSVHGSPVMNVDKYTLSFNGRADNLWTVLHPMIIDGTIRSYYPYDPLLHGLGTWDGSELRYPVIGKDENGSFLTSESVRTELYYLLGRIGSQSDTPLVNQFGKDSVKVLADGSNMFVYPAPDFDWYKDKDILKYRLRVSVLLNKNGKEKKRIIRSIAPIVNPNAGTDEKYEEQEMIWFDFKEITPILKKAHYFDEDLKSVSYLDYFQQKVKNVDFRP